MVVTSFRDGTDDEDSPWYTANIGQFLMAEGVRNDGFLFERDQMIEGFGSHFMSISKASHFNLTGTYGKRDCRKEFTRWLLASLATESRRP